MNGIATGEWLTGERVRRIGWTALGISLLLLVALVASATGTVDLAGRPLGTDFSGVYSAGRMVAEGRAAEAWDWNAHRLVQEQVHGRPGVDFFGWHYPPPFLLIAAALGSLPYLPALLVWQGLTLAACLAVLRRIAGERDTILLALAAPVTLICVAHGHNGFLTGALLGGGLLLLDRRPLFAGVLLGCLLYKPQFALLVGPLLLATLNGRAIVGAALSAGTLVLLTLALWGWPVWQAFLDSLPLTRTVVVEAGSTGFHKIMSPFAAVRLWGFSVPLAYAVQSIATGVAVVATLWTAVAAKPLVRNAAICAATIISTPYVMDYDLVVIGAGCAFLIAEARRTAWLPYERSAIAFIWAAPFFARSLAEVAGVPLGLASALLLLGLALRRTPPAAFKASPFRHSHAASAR